MDSRIGGKGLGGNAIRSRFSISTAVVLVVCALGATSTACAERRSGDPVLKGARTRIDKVRKGDAVLVVVDSSGQPVANAAVEVEQTRHAFLFGCNIFKWGRCRTEEQERAYRRRFAEVFNYATLPYYWWSYEPQRGKPGHAYRRRVAGWCKENGITTKGHPLAWNWSDAQWWPEEPEKLMSLQFGRITDCVERFQGLIDRWDVVNEATHFDRPELADRAPKMTNAMAHVGPVEFTRHCFAAARAAGPKATLLINDYRTDPAYEKLIEQLVAGSNERIYDVIGIQSHMHGGAWPTEKIWEVCERFARFGVPLHFTETTLLSGKQGWHLAKKGSDFKWASTPEGEQRQATETARFYTVLFSHPAVEAITWWDFSDQGAWQQAPAGWLRADMTPKPVFETLKRLIKEQWWTRLKGTTNQAGELRFRGFRGRYHVKITTPQGVKSEGDFELAAKARWVAHTRLGGSK